MEDLEKSLRKMVRPVLDNIFRLWKDKFPKQSLSEVVLTASTAFEDEITKMRVDISSGKWNPDHRGESSWSGVCTKEELEIPSVKSPDESPGKDQKTFKIEPESDGYRNGWLP